MIDVIMITVDLLASAALRFSSRMSLALLFKLSASISSSQEDVCVEKESLVACNIFIKCT